MFSSLPLCRHPRCHRRSHLPSFFLGLNYSDPAAAGPTTLPLFSCLSSFLAFSSFIFEDSTLPQHFLFFIFSSYNFLLTSFFCDPCSLLWSLLDF